MVVSLGGHYLSAKGDGVCLGDKKWVKRESGVHRQDYNEGF